MLSPAEVEGPVGVAVWSLKEAAMGGPKGMVYTHQASRTALSPRLFPQHYSTRNGCRESVLHPQGYCSTWIICQGEHTH